jgi:hypothetical protein
MEPNMQYAALGRKLQQLAVKEPNDMIANAMARLADHLENFGTPFGAKNMAELSQKTGMSPEIIKSLVARANRAGKPAMAESKLIEGLAELAGAAEQDHEVQMARAELYKIAKYAIKLHELLKNISEAEGLEGWQQSKITKAADYIGSVYHALEYDEKVMSQITAESKKLKMKESEATEYKSLLEKAKSKAQQKFMGMVHAAQTGEKPASKEVAKVAKSMPKKAAKDYAATKHKGKPEHVKK